jgi:hypothetical protein
MSIFPPLGGNTEGVFVVDSRPLSKYAEERGIESNSLKKILYSYFQIFA